MKRPIYSILATTCFLLASGLPILAAGGSSVPSTDPADQAAQAYNNGIEKRDKAWELEKKAAAATDAGERAKLEARAQKEYGKAIRAFRSATESDPSMHQAFSSLGSALRKTGEFEESLAAYDQALQLEPGYSEAVTVWLLVHIHDLERIDVLYQALCCLPVEAVAVTYDVQLQRQTLTDCVNQTNGERQQEHAVHDGSRPHNIGVHAGHGVFRGVANQPFLIAHLIHDLVTDIDAGGAADALVLQAVANIDPGRAHLYTQGAIHAVTQARLLRVGTLFA